MDTSSHFYDLVKDSKKILVLDLGFLGDTIHLIPALKCIRDALPKTELSVMVAEHVAPILKVASWIDKVLGYPRPVVGRRHWYQDIGWIMQLRKAHYDAIINLNGSERSSILTWLSGAPLRLGRVPSKYRFHWKYYFTHAVEYPFKQDPLFVQRWHCLKKVGFPGEKPSFDVVVPTPILERVRKQLEDKPFIHISPFTSADFRNLPTQLLVDFIGSEKPNYVLSCAPTPRERQKLDQLLQLLPRPPMAIFPGTLSVLELTALISLSSLHMGGDSGALHIALMTQTPSVSWFYENESKYEWLPPQSSLHQTVIGCSSPDGLKGISLKQLQEAYRRVQQRVS